MESASSVPDAIARAAKNTSPHGIIVLTGSIFLVGEAMKAMGIPA
jgi:folylpolyglutamate synthase/dihydropteroate synthase